MSNEKYEASQTALQMELSNWLQQGEPNAFITYSFRTPVSYEKAIKAFGTHAHALKRHFFGNNSKRRLSMVPVVEKFHKGESYGALEKPEEGIHIHCLIRLPQQPKDHMEMVRSAWIEADPACGDPSIYCPNGDDWFLELNTSEAARRLINYALKTCTQDTAPVLWKFVSLGH